MGRWTQDSYSLPDGMQRIGYDSDTHRYTFRDRQGAIWQGGEYGGELRQVSGPPGSSKNDDEPIRIRPNAPIPTPGVSHMRASSNLSSFQDFLPAGKIVSATAVDKSSSPTGTSQKSPTSTKSTVTSKWNLLRSKSTNAAPKMQSIVHAALSHSKTDPGAKNGKYRPLDGRSSAR